MDPAAQVPHPIPLLPPDALLLFSPERDAGYIHFEQGGKYPYRCEARGVDLTNASWLADASLLAYWDRDGTPANAGAAERLALAGLRLAAFIRSRTADEMMTWNDTQCQVAAGAGAIIVAFRGTESAQWRDAATDAVFGKVAWPYGAFGGMVHAGFKEGLEVVWPEVIAAVRSAIAAMTGAFRPSGPSVWLTGHSLGAALATLAADRLESEGVLVAGVYTFGSPRVGDSAFARSFESRLGGKCFRFVNGSDLVTRLPPPGLILDYHHVGTEVHLDAVGGGEVLAPRPPAPHPHSLGATIDGVFSSLADSARNLKASTEQLVDHATMGIDWHSLSAETRECLYKLSHWRQITLLPPDLLDHTPRRYATLLWNQLPASAPD